MLKTIKNARIAPAANDDIYEAPGTKKMSIIAMRAGNRPLQGTKLLVSTAISRSRERFYYPAACHPTGIAAEAHTHGKRLFAMRAATPESVIQVERYPGRYPKSSSNVNNGKKIAIGGSITDITHVSVV